jgi:hypothetical protein
VLEAEAGGDESEVQARYGCRMLTSCTMIWKLIFRLVVSSCRYGALSARTDVNCITFPMSTNYPCRHLSCGRTADSWRRNPSARDGDVPRIVPGAGSGQPTGAVLPVASYERTSQTLSGGVMRGR